MLIGHSLANKAGIILAVDRQICEIMQRGERDLVGVSFETLTHPDDCRRNIIAVAGLQIGDGPLTLQKRYVRPDRSAVWASVQVSRLPGDDGGHLVGTIQLTNPEALRRDPESLWRAAKCADALIQRRRRELGDDIFGDYGWIVLVQIYLAEAEGRLANIASISDRAAIRLSLVAQSVELLEQKMLVERTGWPGLFPQLTAYGMRKVEALLDDHFGH